MAKIWVYAEIGSSGTIDPTALELLAKARELGTAEAVALGPGATDAAPTLGEHGAETVYASDDVAYADCIAQPAAYALNELVAEHKPDLILFATNYDSRDIAGRLGAKTGSTLMSNATGLPALDIAQTSIFGGSTIVDVRLEGSPVLVLVRPKSFVSEAVGGDERHVGTEAGAEIPNQAAPVRIQEAADEDRVGLSQGDALGEAIEVASLGVPPAGADNLEPEIPCRRFYVGTEGTEVAVREDEESPRAQLLDELGVGHGLQVVGGRDADEVSLARRVQNLGLARAVARVGAREIGPCVRGADHRQGTAGSLVRNRDLHVRAD